MANSRYWPGGACRGRYCRPSARHDPLLTVTNVGFEESRLGFVHTISPTARPFQLTSVMGVLEAVGGCK